LWHLPFNQSEPDEMAVYLSVCVTVYCNCFLEYFVEI